MRKRVVKNYILLMPFPMLGAKDVKDFLELMLLLNFAWHCTMVEYCSLLESSWWTANTNNLIEFSVVLIIFREIHT